MEVEEVRIARDENVRAGHGGVGEQVVVVVIPGHAWWWLLKLGKNLSDSLQDGDQLAEVDRLDSAGQVGLLVRSRNQLVEQLTGQEELESPSYRRPHHLVGSSVAIRVQEEADEEVGVDEDPHDATSLPRRVVGSHFARDLADEALGEGLGVGAGEIAITTADPASQILEALERGPTAIPLFNLLEPQVLSVADDDGASAASMLDHDLLAVIGRPLDQGSEVDLGVGC